MSLTTIDKIRPHLSHVDTGERRMTDQVVRISADAYVELPHAGITPDSETVKNLMGDAPTAEAVVFDTPSISLAQNHLLHGAVVVGDNSSLSRIYSENIDYLIDYDAGTITRIASGAIAADTAAMIWYQYYRVYRPEYDYDIDYATGRIRRVASGDIPENCEVFVDYLLQGVRFDDTEIEQCIREAEAQITGMIDPGFAEATDEPLQTAATWLALASLWRNASTITNREAYLALSRAYHEYAMELIKPYRRRVPNINGPRLT